MQRISSKTTFFVKKVFPVIWFSMLGLVMVMSLALPHKGAAQPGMLIMPFVMAGFGFFIIRRLVSDLADEVYDCGDALLVKNGTRQIRVPFADIMNVSATLMVNPPRVTLTLAHPSEFGTEISFSPVRPTLTLNPFAKNAIVQDLITRVDAARVNRRR